MDSHLVEKRPMLHKANTSIRLAQRDRKGDVRSDYIFGRYRVDWVETERTESVPGTHLPAVLILRREIISLLLEQWCNEVIRTPERPFTELL